MKVKGSRKTNHSQKKPVWRLATLPRSMVPAAMTGTRTQMAMGTS